MTVPNGRPTFTDFVKSIFRYLTTLRNLINFKVLFHVISMSFTTLHVNSDSNVLTTVQCFELINCYKFTSLF